MQTLARKTFQVRLPSDLYDDLRSLKQKKIINYSELVRSYLEDVVSSQNLTPRY